MLPLSESTGRNFCSGTLQSDNGERKHLLKCPAHSREPYPPCQEEMGLPGPTGEAGVTRTFCRWAKASPPRRTDRKDLVFWCLAHSNGSPNQAGGEPLGPLPLPAGYHLSSPPAHFRAEIKSRHSLLKGLELLGIKAVLNQWIVMTQRWAGGEAQTVRTVPKPKLLWIPFRIAFSQLFGDVKTKVPCSSRDKLQSQHQKHPCTTAVLGAGTVHGPSVLCGPDSTRTAAGQSQSRRRRRSEGGQHNPPTEPTAPLAVFTWACGFLSEETRLNGQLFYIAFHTARQTIDSEWLLEITQRLGKRYTFRSVHRDPVGP